MSSLRDLAQLAGASATATSAVLHGGARSIRVADERRRAIIAAARSARYRPGDDIALVLRQHPSRLGDAGLRFLHALQAATAAVVHVQIAAEGEIPSLIARWKVGGVVCHDHTQAAIEAHCAERGIPCVAANPADENHPGAVHVDDGAAIMPAAAWLARQGCRRLALCAPRIEHQAHQRRIAALHQAADRHGLGVTVADARDFDQALDRLALTSGEPCGVFALADWYLGVATAARLIGGDHHLVCIKRPGSPWVAAESVIATPWDAVAARCLARIADAWQGRHAPASDVIATTWKEPPA